MGKPLTAFSTPAAGENVLDSLAAHFPTIRVTTRPVIWTYLDTFDWRIHRDGGALAVTASQNGFLLRWSSREGEERQKLDQETFPEFGADLPSGRFQDALHQVIEMRRLLALAQVRVLADTLRILNRDAKTVGWVALQRLSAREPGARRAFQALPDRLEVTPLRGYRNSYRNIVSFLEEKQKLRRIESGVLDIALEKIGKEPGDYSTKLRVRLQPQMETADAVRVLLSHLFQTLLANREGVCSHIDTEFLHDFRVAVRRTRSALTQIKRIFPVGPTERFKKEFAWLTGLTSPSRDLDVLLLKLGDYTVQLPEQSRETLKPLAEIIQARCKQEHQKLSRGLASKRFERLLKSWEHFLAEPPPATSKGASPILVVASKRIRTACNRVLTQGDRTHAATAPETLHQLRIECKKLRYLLEFFRSLYPEDEMSRLIEALKDLQDNLGDFNDFAVHKGMLEDFARDLMNQESIDAETLMSVGRLVDLLERLQDDQRKIFATQYRAFSRNSNRRRMAGLFDLV